MKELKALSYENLLRLAINRGDKELQEEIKNDMEVEKYWEEFFKSGAEREEQKILN